jgi:CO/xanthine dehydrogenase Mo-binding subunit
VYYSHLSYVAQVAEVATQNGKPSLQKIYAACDCGVVVNLSGARQQVMGGIVDGLGHAMFGNLTFKDGSPEQNNFNTYRLIRLNEIRRWRCTFVEQRHRPDGPRRTGTAAHRRGRRQRPLQGHRQTPPQPALRRTGGVKGRFVAVSSF